MEKNTVILDITYYDKLKEYEQRANLPREHTVVVHTNRFGQITVYTDDDAVRKLAWEIKTTEDLLTKEKEKFAEINEKYDELRKEVTTDEVKKMSIYRFLKWRKS